MDTNEHPITPFTVRIPEEEVDDLHRRLDATRWPDELPFGADGGWDRGVPAPYLRALADRWRSAAWGALEARLNRFPQFTTTIDGQRMHFIHVRSAEPGALPMVLTHGWPSTPYEFLEVVGPLTDPVAHGGQASDAFDVVI